MKDPQNTLSLSSLIRRLYRLYRPYFGLRKNKKWRTLSGISMLIISLIMAYTMNLIHVAMNDFIAVIGPSITYGAYFGTLGVFFGTIMIYAAFCYINTWIASWLAESLTHAIAKKMTKKWLGTNAFIGNKLISNAHTDLDISRTLSHDNQRLNNRVLELINNGLMVLGNFAVGAIGLYAMSIPLEISVFAISITIPGYLLISTVCYALFFNYFNEKASRKLIKSLADESNLDSAFQHKIHNIDTHAEAIAFKKGRLYELKSLLETLKNNRVIKKTIIKVQSALVFLNIFNQEFSQFISFILASPSVIAGKLQISGLFELGNNFSFIVQAFNWKGTQIKELCECEVELQKLEAFKQQIENWESIAQQTQGNLHFSCPSQSQKFANIEINHLSVKIPGGKQIFQNYTTHIPKKKHTLLHGPSGRGKTSILRSLLNLNVHAQGEINGLPDKTVFIPSEPYFPHNKSLIQAIIYPNESMPTLEERAKIINLMNMMGFDQSKIAMLDEVKDWYSSILSDGERKRLMIINMLIKDPEVVIMDEATRGIDPPTKIIVEETINQYLPKSTILFTDHNPSDKQFYHQKIEL